MKSRLFIPLFAIILFATLTGFSQTNYKYLKSPDSRISIGIGIETNTNSLVCLASDGIHTVSFIPSMTLADGKILGQGLKKVSYKQNSVNETIAAHFYKRSSVINHYNSLTMVCGSYSVEFRAYNDGIAYRFVTSMKDSITISQEQFDLSFEKDYLLYLAHSNAKDTTHIEAQFFNSFENVYVKKGISKQSKNHLGFLPALIDFEDGNKLLLSEANVQDYPGMFILPTGKQGELKAIFSPYPKREKQGGHNLLQLLVLERENFIARTAGTRAFPWRQLLFSTNDAQLANSDMTYCLAEKSHLEDLSWIKPGKVAWDWWNDWNLKGVPFRTGVNNETYKYYIDFASKNGIEYVILDEGWAVNKQADLMQVVPEINLPELVAYAKQRHVDLILWAGYWALKRDMENIISHYSKMGIKGFKVDFFDRNDQKIVRFTEKLAALCAQYKMVVDLHGIFPPSGLQRTYPNILNYEAVSGLEQLKWQGKKYDAVTFETEIPFIRQTCGTMDFTQGAMRNTTKRGYYPNYSNPTSQGTRCRQLAEYMIFESPINMLCDSPTNYEAEPEATSFISSIPTTWDETVIIDGKVSEYVVIARRSGHNWYIGGITNWTARDITIDFTPFIGNQDKTKITLFTDGVNADRNAEDFLMTTPKVSKSITIHLAPGGGFATSILAE